MAVPLEDTFRGTEAFFEFSTRSRDNELFIGHFRVFSYPLTGPKMSMTIPISQLRRNCKIASVPLKVSSRGVPTWNMSQFDAWVWAVGGLLAILTPAHLVFRALLYILATNVWNYIPGWSIHRCHKHSLWSNFEAVRTRRYSQKYSWWELDI